MDKGKLWQVAVENCIISGYTSPNTKKKDQIKGNWIGTHIREERCKQYILENPKERCHLGDHATCKRIIFKLIIRETRSDYVDWIHLAQERKMWQAPIFVVINPEIPLKQMWETSSLLTCCSRKILPVVHLQSSTVACCIC